MMKYVVQDDFGGAEEVFSAAIALPQRRSAMDRYRTDGSEIVRRIVLSIRMVIFLLFVAVVSFGVPSEGAAQPTSKGALGETSKASISISVSVRPRTEVLIAPTSEAPLVRAQVGPAKSDHICLATNMPEGSYAVMLQDAAETPSRSANVQIAVDPAASSICTSRLPNNATHTVGLIFPPDGAVRGRGQILVISPE